MKKRGQREPDNIADALERILDVSIRKLEFELLTEIKNLYEYRMLVLLSQGATQQDNEQLACAILHAKMYKMRIAPIIDDYAKKYIYPHRKRTR